MAVPWNLVGGASVACSDGPCGALGRIILEPETRMVTHLAVEPAGLTSSSGRLVPIRSVRAIDETIHLGCSIADFEGFDPDETYKTVMTPSAMSLRGGIMPLTAQLILHQVPEGEFEINSDENIVATDGHGGHLLGLTINPTDYRITALVLRVGHPLRKRDVSITIEAITGIEDGRMTLSLSKEEIAQRASQS